MDIHIRFRHPDWIFMDPMEELDGSLLEELDPGEEELEELYLSDDGYDLFEDTLTGS